MIHRAILTHPLAYEFVHHREFMCQIEAIVECLQSTDCSVSSAVIEGRSWPLSIGSPMIIIARMKPGSGSEWEMRIKVSCFGRYFSVQLFHVAEERILDSLGSCATYVIDYDFGGAIYITEYMRKKKPCIPKKKNGWVTSELKVTKSRIGWDDLPMPIEGVIRKLFYAHADAIKNHLTGLAALY